MTEADAVPGRDEAHPAIAFRVMKATGCYRAPGPELDVHLSFGRVTITHADGTERYVNLSVD
jgi:hypothetical protein